MESDEISVIATGMRRRSFRIRLFAQFLIFVIVLVVSVTMAFFFTTSQYMPNVDGGKRLSLSFLGFRFDSEDVYKGATNSASSKDGAITEELASLRAENVKLKEQASQTALAINTIGSAILRIGSVVLAVYLIQVLVHLTRYNFRIADHIDSLADLLLLTQGSPERLGAMADIFSARHISFGPQPPPASEKLTNVLEEVVKKLPGK